MRAQNTRPQVAIHEPCIPFGKNKEENVIFKTRPQVAFSKVAYLVQQNCNRKCKPEKRDFKAAFYELTFLGFYFFKKEKRRFLVNSLLFFLLMYSHTHLHTLHQSPLIHHFLARNHLTNII